MLRCSAFRSPSYLQDHPNPVSFVLGGSESRVRTCHHRSGGRGRNLLRPAWVQRSTFNVQLHSATPSQLRSPRLRARHIRDRCPTVRVRVPLCRRAWARRRHKSSDTVDHSGLAGGASSYKSIDSLSESAGFCGKTCTSGTCTSAGFGGGAFISGTTCTSAGFGGGACTTGTFSGGSAGGSPNTFTLCTFTLCHSTSKSSSIIRFPSMVTTSSVQEPRGQR